MLPADLARFRRSTLSTTSTEAVIVWHRLQRVCDDEASAERGTPKVVLCLRGCGGNARRRFRTT